MAAQYASKLAKLEATYKDAVAAIEATREPQEAFDRASQLADTLRQYAKDASDRRALAALRIAEDEKLSLAVLADRISTSKARAAQLVQHARDTKGKAGTRDQPDLDGGEAPDA